MEKEPRPNALVRRRNTLDTIIFNEMCDKADKDCENETKEDAKESGRKCKRSLKLLRGNERDLKLDIEIASYEKCGGSMGIPTPNQIKVRNYECIQINGKNCKSQHFASVYYACAFFYVH